MNYRTAREILSEAIENLDEASSRHMSRLVSEGMVKAVNKLKKRNFLASKGTAMRPSAFVSPEAHKAALVASAREKMK